MTRPYTTDDKVRNYIDADGSAGFGTDILSTTRLAQKITDADNIIDMKLSKRYPVPFATTPPAIE